MAFVKIGEIIVDPADGAWFSKDVMREEAAKAAQIPTTINPLTHLIWGYEGRNGVQCVWSVEYLYSMDGARIYRKL